MSGSRLDKSARRTHKNFRRMRQNSRQKFLWLEGQRVYATPSGIIRYDEK